MPGAKPLLGACVGQPELSAFRKAEWVTETGFLAEIGVVLTRGRGPFPSRALMPPWTANPMPRSVRQQSSVV